MIRGALAPREGASLALPAAALLLCLALGCAAAATLICGLRRLASRPRPPAPSAEELGAILSAVDAWGSDPSPEADSFHDPSMASRDGPAGRLEVADLSGRVDPDWTAPELFDQIPLRPFLLPCADSSSIAARRDEAAPSLGIRSAYASCFSEEAFGLILCAYAYPSPDAFLPARRPLGRYLRSASGTEADVEGLLALFERRREAGSPGPLAADLPPWDRELAPLLSDRPPLNANTAPPALVEAVLSLCGHPSPAQAASALLRQRAAREILPAELPLLLSLSPRSRALSILGCRSWFREIRLEGGGRLIRAIALRPLPGRLPSDRPVLLGIEVEAPR